ncbi:PREDICTED: serine/threonine-protein kinase prpf4B-like isoform X1 [Ipomoea nil]|uniref:serine/threonine-protein kinase prpf4B-like isoform X1 n=2 Tax=Ipomoea nil TaxID=35883 RepID=UPI0009019072|nr:PREDICTED: serine/threonine-protein kinase prpf4B-like isoform X1 [Ipomoea nil]
MTSDSSDPARRKHHRSSHSDVETDEPSKRRKHGHHHHHHRRRHHRHHGKKHEEIDSKLETEVKEAEVETEGGKEVLGSGAVGVAMSSSNLGIDYDMEEGEIIEDDVPPTSAAYDVAEDIENKKLSSDMDHHEAHAEGPNFGMPIEKKVEEADRSKNHEGLSWEGIFSEKYLANGNLVGERHKHEGKCSPIEESRTQKHYYGDRNDLKDRKRSLTPDNAGKRRKTAKVALPRDGYEDEGPYGKDSKSPDRSRGLPQSQSTSEEVSISEVFHKPEGVFYKDRKYKGDKDYERVTGLIRDYCHGSQGFLKEKERERSSSRSRYSSQDDRFHSHETAERYREGSREIDRDRTKNRDRERGRTQGNEGDRVTERNRERERVRQKEMERGRAHERGRVREKEIEEDRAHERERVREKEIERDRARERERERERDNYRDRQWDNDRKRERESRWESDRESSRGRSRDKERDKETDRYRRTNKYDDLGSSYGDRDKYSASRRIKDDGTGHREKKNDPVIKISDQKLHEIETDISKRDEDEQDYQEEISFQLAEHEEEEELDRIKEESRKRKLAILEKYKNLQLHPKTQLEDTAKEVIEHSSELEVGGNHMPEAVDGRAEGGESRSGDKVISVGKSPNQEGFATNDQNSGAGGLGQGTPKSERSNDMFCDDIFGESPAVHKTGKGDGLMIERNGLHDNWDDAEGYYSYRFGEVLDGRYEIIASHGKGVFSTVVRARDLKAKPGDPEEVAIKMIRNNDTMYKAGMEELVILKKLVGADPEDRRHCVRFLSSFKYRNHLCLVFESLHMNLREVLKKFGRNIGLKLTAVRTYAKQLFISLKHLKNCGVLHSDIKPDNMLVNEAKNVLKLCDFGNAMFAGKNDITPYLVSRFYRAPEIILGLPYDHPIDMWSVGCCIFELYTGKVLFPGPTNNDMLRLHMELKGPFPKKMLRKGAFTDQHFDQDLNFYATEEDPVTKKAIRKLIVNIRPRDIGAIISGSPGEDPKMLTHFKDLLDRIFVLDPDKRLTVSQALSHPFITEKISDWGEASFLAVLSVEYFLFLLISIRIMRQPFSALDA